MSVCHANPWIKAIKESVDREINLKS